MLLSLSYNAGGAYKASGRPQINTWTGLSRLILLFPSLWWAVAVAKSIVAVSWVHASVALAGTLLNMYVAARMLELPFRDMGKAVFPALLSGALMAGAVFGFLVSVQNFEAWVQLFGGVVIGGVTYAASLWFFQPDVISDAVQILRETLKKG
jgi:PST family polysaccharide transporter